jgi:F-type H+-transporting ATPase subunit alpha
VQLGGVGLIHSIRDDLITVTGLSEIGMGGVLITKSNTKLLITAIHATHIVAVAFQNPIQLLDKINDNVYFFSSAITLAAHFNYFNRIIDSLGNTLLNLSNPKSKIRTIGKFTIVRGFTVAASIANRMPVCESVQTGVKIIDLIIPIGRGQRELIIGDRKTGKTQIIVDSIMNQRRNNMFLSIDGQNIKKLICIYIGIGQRSSSIKQLALRLARKNSL